MLAGPPSKTQLTNTFQRVFDGIMDRDLDSCPDGIGLDEATTAALNDLAADRKRRASKQLAARNAFAMQMQTFGQPADESAWLANLLDT
jgi:hypothetical protein